MEIYENGTILTMVDECPNARAILVENGRIREIAYSVSETELMRILHPDAVRIDLRHQVLMPGFIDGHSYFFRSASETGQDLNELTSESIDRAIRQYVSAGVTTAQDGATTGHFYSVMRRRADAGKLPIDLVSYFCDNTADDMIREKNPRQIDYRNHYRCAGIELSLDGCLQDKEAWLSSPYLRPPAGKDASWCGQGLYTDSRLTAIFTKAIRRHWQILAHASGDRAIDQFLRCYRAAKLTSGDTTDLRPVLINCLTIRKDQIDACVENRFLPSFLIDQLYAWGDYHVRETLGYARARHIGPLSGALSLGIRFSLHQGTPVNEISPIRAVHVAVNRTTKGGEVLGPEHRITAWEALKAVTIHAAYQIFEENEKGSIEIGKRADFAVLSANPLLQSPAELKDIRVTETIKDGRVVYRAPVSSSCAGTENSVPASAY